MRDRKLNYRFYNPNTVEATADLLLEIFMEVNLEKVEKAIQKAAEQLKDEEEGGVGHLA